MSQKKLVQYKPRELMHALSNSVWKTGFLKSVFKIPFPYFIFTGYLENESSNCRLYFNTF